MAPKVGNYSPCACGAIIFNILHNICCHSCSHINKKNPLRWESITSIGLSIILSHPKRHLTVFYVIFHSLMKSRNSWKLKLTQILKTMCFWCTQVFPSDKMPQYICDRCRFFMDISYEFKQICRQADETILEFIQTGTPLEAVTWPPILSKVIILFNIIGWEIRQRWITIHCTILFKKQISIALWYCYKTLNR